MQAPFDALCACSHKMDAPGIFLQWPWRLPHAKINKQQSSDVFATFDTKPNNDYTSQLKN